MLDAERRKRVLDRRDDRRRHRHHAGFADALDAERVERRRRFVVEDLDARHARRRHQQIFGERRGDRLAVVVEAHPFEERVADAVHDAADDLALDHHRIDRAAAIMREDEALDRDPAGLDIDLDLGDRGAVGIGHGVDDDMLGRLEPRRDPPGSTIARPARDRARDLGERDAHRRRALDPDAVAGDLEIVRRGFEQMLAIASTFSRTLSAARCADDPAITAWRLLKPPMPRAIAALSPGVTVICAMIAAELFGDDLRQHGLGALPHRGGAGRTCTLPDGADPHRHALERTAPGALDEIGDADADDSGPPRAPRLARAETRPSRRAPAPLLAARIVAAVEHDRQCRRASSSGVAYGIALGRDEIAPPHLGAVEAELARHAVEQPLHHEGALRLAGAAHRRHRHLVGERELDLEAIGRHARRARSASAPRHRAR